MRETTKCLVHLHFAVFLFGLAGVLGKIIALPVLLIVLGRTTFAVIPLFLLLLLAKKPFRIYLLRDAGGCLLMGLVLAAHWASFFYSVQISTVAIALFTYSSFPLFVTFLEPWWFKEKIRRKDIIMAVVVCLGLVLVVPEYSLSDQMAQGAFWGLVSGFTFALLALVNRTYVARYSPLTLSFYQNLVATLVLLPFLWYVDLQLRLNQLLLLVFLGVFCTAMAHSMFIQGMTRVKAQAASVIASLEPVYGIVIALLWLSEVPQLRTVLGGLLILGATTYGTRRAA